MSSPLEAAVLLQDIGMTVSGEWIKHNGTACPVPKGTLVDIRCRNGDRFNGVAAGIKIEVLPFFWQGSGSEFDIIEYRIWGAMQQ